jgi:hypothetical protein
MALPRRGSALRPPQTTFRRQGSRRQSILNLVVETYLPKTYCSLGIAFEETKDHEIDEVLMYKRARLGFSPAAAADAPERQDLLDGWRAYFMISALVGE